jgi:Uma2 family endonuclease
MIGEVLAKTQIGVEEYLALVFDDRPEPDYVDGEVVERALPTPTHSRIQALLILLFAPLMTRFKLVLQPELRVRIEPRRFRVIDLAVYRDSRPEGRYATNPAYVVVEIVSPDDRYTELTQRLEDYRRWGVPHVWLVDPELKRLYEYSEVGLLQHAGLRLPEFDFEISAQELFKDN